MPDNKSKKAQDAKKPTSGRIPAHKLLLDFISANRIILVVDEVNVVNEDVPNHVYVNIIRPRVRAFYQDDVNKPKGNTTEQVKKPVEIVN